MTEKVKLFLRLEGNKMALYICVKNWTENQGGKNDLNQRTVLLGTQMTIMGWTLEKSLLLPVTGGFRATFQEWCFERRYTKFI